MFSSYADLPDSIFGRSSLLLAALKSGRVPLRQQPGRAPTKEEQITPAVSLFFVSTPRKLQRQLGIATWAVAAAAKREDIFLPSLSCTNPIKNTGG